MNPDLSWADTLVHLRQKLIHIFIIMGLGFFIAWLFSGLIIERLKEDLLPEEATLIVTTPLEYVMVKIEVSLIFSVLLALPFIIYWTLRRFNIIQRKVSILLWGLGALTLLLIGFSFTYFFLLPVALKILTSLPLQAGITPFFTIGPFILFIVLTTLVFSIVFELPLVITWMAINGVVSIDSLKEKRKHVYVGIFVLSAIITADPTPVSQIFLSLPLIFLYEVSIIAAKIFVRR